jgi:hypothetical protein
MEITPKMLEITQRLRRRESRIAYLIDQIAIEMRDHHQELKNILNEPEETFDHKNIFEISFIRAAYSDVSVNTKWALSKEDHNLTNGLDKASRDRDLSVKWAEMNGANLNILLNEAKKKLSELPE